MYNIQINVDFEEGLWKLYLNIVYFIKKLNSTQNNYLGQELFERWSWFWNPLGNIYIYLYTHICIYSRSCIFM